MISTIKTNYTAIRAVMIFGIIVGISGCVLPVPVQEGRYSRYIAPEMVNKIISGKNTRKDVLLLLGEPEGFEDNQKVFIYSNEKREKSLQWVIVAATPYSAGIMPLDYKVHYSGYRLIIEFNDNGVVVGSKYELTKSSSIGSGK